jgi:hypothetical protein
MCQNRLPLIFNEVAERGWARRSCCRAFFYELLFGPIRLILTKTVPELLSGTVLVSYFFKSKPDTT